MRLRRWAEHLRSYIPGADNNFADLLSRNGCTKAVNTWQEEKLKQQQLEEAVINASPQMAIIKPEVMTKSKRASNKDLDVVGTDLMPLVSTDGWPTAKRLFEAQKAHGIKSDHMKKSSTHPLQVNSTGKMLLPKDHPVTLEVIVICHQGDTFHRSVMDTLKEFPEHYVMHGMGKTAEKEFIRALCRRCLSCIKTKTGSTIPRPMWYMVYATKPFEYIHMDFIQLPEAANGCKYILALTCDFSLTTVLQPTRNADADTVVKVLLEQYLPTYPDPDLIHSDGDTHFINDVVERITKARGIKHTICTPYAK